MISRALPLTLVTACLMGGAGCSDRAWTRQDSWYAPPPAELAQGFQLDASRIHEVPEGRQEEAQSMLLRRPLVPLTPQQTYDFTGGNVSDAQEGRFYLVRGVCLNKNAGQFTVRQSESDLAVHHECLGAWPVPMRRWALVVQLDQEPDRVFVDCGMNE